MKKLLAILLCLLLLFAMVPAGVVPVAAKEVSIENVNDMGKLGAVFNMLGDKHIGDNTGMRHVFVSTEGVTAQFDDNPTSRSSYSYITSMSEYFSNASASLKSHFATGTETNTKVKVKVVETEVKQKFGLDIQSSVSGDSSSNSKDSTEYMLMEYSAILGTYSMWLDNSNQISRLWATDENGNYTVLNGDFVHSLLNDSPEDFFSLYGTHIVTQYTAGGTAISSFSGAINYDSSETNIDVELQHKEGAEGALTMYTEMQSRVSSGSGSSSENSVKQGTTVAYGSPNFNWTEAGASAWAKELDRYNNHIVIVDDNLKMLPVWELLVGNDPQMMERRIQLEQYFNTHVDEEYAEIYGDYIYSPITHNDYNGYTFIQTAEEFNNIRNDLNGKYVLLNNIDLGDVEWTPIGTEEAPFKGIIDGNGNTVSGLSITQNGEYIGLIGYNAGTIENLDVSGDIDVAGSGNENGVAYMGGIVGYNVGFIINCRNRVAVNGELTIDAQEVVPETAQEQDNFFTQHAAAIKDAKGVTLQTLTDNAKISVGASAVRFTGKATGVTITVTAGSAENDPAYIVLENAEFTGTIQCAVNRPVCIISVGEGNRLVGSADTGAINVNGDLFVTGDADLVLVGGNGSNGSNGNGGGIGSEGAYKEGQTRGGTGGSGGAGSNGQNGNPGMPAVDAVNFSVSLDAKMDIIGGDGGNGGKGGTGGNGGKGGSNTANFWGSAGAGNGGTGGNGGNGGNGGSGASPISTEAKLTVYSGDISMYNGNGGNGGNGGTGGRGGQGGNTYRWGAYCGWAGGGGSGGRGGQGGNAGLAGKYQYDAGKIAAVGSDASVYIRIGLSGVIGNGNHGGAVGAKGVFEFDRDWFDSGTDYSKTYASNGTPDVIDYTVNEVMSLCTLNKAYRAYNAPKIYTDAKATKSLVSIGTAEEQALLEQMLNISHDPENTYWIGMEIIRVLSGDFVNGEILMKWQDGTYVRVVMQEGQVVSADNVLVDEKNAVSTVLGEAYINFAAGEPNQANGEEWFVHFDATQTWNDHNNDIQHGYIEEILLDNSSQNTADEYALVIGGVCGYNAGTIKEAYNVAPITAEKAEAQNTGIGAYAGGISGYNNGFIFSSTNTGAIKALALTGAMSFYADAHAHNICAGLGATDSTGYAQTVVNAYSSNDLEKICADESILTEGDEDSTKTALDEYWKNSELVIVEVGCTEYSLNSAFEKTSLHLTRNTSVINAYYVRYNFFAYGTTTVSIDYSDGTDDYTRYIPVNVVKEIPVALDTYLVPQKTSFELGSAFTYDGLALQITYNSGRKELINSKTEKQFSVVAPDMSSFGPKTVMVTYTADSGEVLSCDYEIVIEGCLHKNRHTVPEVLSTCFTQGHGEYTECMDCGTVVSGSKELLPSIPHTYDNDCDALCNVCGGFRQTAPHVYDNACDGNCNVCNAGRDVASHVYDSACDADCNACGAKRDVIGHVYDNVCDAYCNICSGYRSVDPHLYDNACDAYCNNCGLFRQAGDHIYNNACDTDCNVCGEVRVPAAHVYDNVCDADCNVCGTLRQVGDHVYVGKVTMEPTCVDDGIKTYTCFNCNATYIELIPALGHNSHAVVIVPDCENEGYTIYTCTKCDNRYVGDYVNPVGHTSVTTPGYDATCEATGLTDGEKCSVCDKVLKPQNIIPAFGHTSQIIPGKAATCTETGLTAGEKCSVCQVILKEQEIIPATGHAYDDDYDAECNNCGFYRDALCKHDYNAVVTAPDCVNGGYTTYTCTKCQDTYVDRYTSALGHNYNAVVTAPDCVNGGYTTYTCTNCGDSYVGDAVAALGHNYNAIVTKPDCENGGYTTYSCANCDDTYVGEYTDALGHTIVVVPGYAATCARDGLTDGEQCSACGKNLVAQEILPATGDHEYSFRVTTPATCGADGVRTYTCVGCDASYTEAIPATGEHAYDDAYDAGCNVCGHIRPVDTPLPEDAPAFVLESATASAGDTFTVAIRTERNSGIVSLKLRLTYDSDVLALISVEEKDFSGMSFSPMTNNPFMINWLDAINPNNTTNGVLLLLTFRVRDDAPIGKTDIVLSYDAEDVYNQNFDNVGFRVENGVVNVVDYTPGDVNNDGRVNNKDLGILQQYVNEWDVTVNKQAADVTGDGRINNKDLGRLQQYLNEWDVVLG